MTSLLIGFALAQLQHNDRWVAELTQKFSISGDDPLNISLVFKESCLLVGSTGSPVIKHSRTMISTVFDGQVVPPTSLAAPIEWEQTPFAPSKEQVNDYTDFYELRLQRPISVIVAKLPIEKGSFWTASFDQIPIGRAPKSKMTYTINRTADGEAFGSVSYKEDTQKPMLGSGECVFDLSTGILKSMKLKLADAPLPGTGLLGDCELVWRVTQISRRSGSPSRRTL